MKMCSTDNKTTKPEQKVFYGSGSRKKIGQTYFKLCQTYFKIGQTYFFRYDERRISFFTYAGRNGKCSLKDVCLVWVNKFVLHTRLTSKSDIFESIFQNEKQAHIYYE